MTKNLVTISTKGKYKCNLCRSTTSPKDGDWFEAISGTPQQVFLCKGCETSHKADYRRYTTQRFG